MVVQAGVVLGAVLVEQPSSTVTVAHLEHSVVGVVYSPLCHQVGNIPGKTADAGPRGAVVRAGHVPEVVPADITFVVVWAAVVARFPCDRLCAKRARKKWGRRYRDGTRFPHSYKRTLTGLPVEAP